jgi:predicted kinase
MLYIFSGLPGTGKSTLARLLASELKAVHLRVDTIEQAIREGGGQVSGPEGYIVAYHIAEDNLRLGLSVIADTVNPIQITRQAWRAVATQIGVPFVEIEVICSDPFEHRARVETRQADIAGFQLPTWDEVMNRKVESWDTQPIVIDTAGQTPAQSSAALMQALACKIKS